MISSADFEHPQAAHRRRRRLHPCWLILTAGWASLWSGSPESVAEAPREPVTVVARGAAEALSCRQLQQFAVSPAGSRSWARLRGQEDARQRLARQLTAESRLAREAEAASSSERHAVRTRLAESREAILLQALETDFAAGLEISESEARGYYRQHRRRFHTPPRLVSRFIMLRLEPDAGTRQVEQARRQLEAIRQEYLGGANFGELAERYSQAENAARGGTVAASPRHSLLPAYEEIAWALEDGEVSPPVRLRDGLALILKERIFPARHRSFEQARAGIIERLEHEAMSARRRAVIERAEARWPVSRESDAGDPVLRLGGKSYSLADLGLDHRPPFLERRIEEALERLWLLRTAEHEGIAERHAVNRQLDLGRQRILARARLDQLVSARLAPPAEGTLRARYERRRDALHKPAERRFEVLIVAGEEGKLRRARMEAEDLADRWRSTGRAPAGADLELWGPLPRDVLAKSLSPLFAARAFSLTPGGISDPLRLETYSRERLKFVGRGYAVLRVVDEQPAVSLTFAEARPQLVAEASIRPARRLRARLIREVASQPPLELDEQALAACQLPGNPAE